MSKAGGQMENRVPVELKEVGEEFYDCVGDRCEVVLRGLLDSGPYFVVRRLFDGFLRCWVKGDAAYADPPVNVKPESSATDNRIKIGPNALKVGDLFYPGCDEKHEVVGRGSLAYGSGRNYLVVRRIRDGALRCLVEDPTPVYMDPPVKPLEYTDIKLGLPIRHVRWPEDTFHFAVVLYVNKNYGKKLITLTPAGTVFVHPWVAKKWVAYKGEVPDITFISNDES